MRRAKEGTPCQCKAIETKHGAWRCRLHGGLSTGPKSARAGPGSAGQHTRWARATGNPLVPIVIAVNHMYLPLTAVGDVRRDWAAPDVATSKVTVGTTLRAPTDIATSLVQQGMARLA